MVFCGNACGTTKNEGGRNIGHDQARNAPGYDAAELRREAGRSDGSSAKGSWRVQNSREVELLRVHQQRISKHFLEKDANSDAELVKGVMRQLTELYEHGDTARINGRLVQSVVQKLLGSERVNTFWHLMREAEDSKRTGISAVTRRAICRSELLQRFAVKPEKAMAELDTAAAQCNDLNETNDAARAPAESNPANCGKQNSETKRAGMAEAADQRLEFPGHGRLVCLSAPSSDPPSTSRPSQSPCWTARA